MEVVFHRPVGTAVVDPAQTPTCASVNVLRCAIWPSWSRFQGAFRIFCACHHPPCSAHRAANGERVFRATAQRGTNIQPGQGANPRPELPRVMLATHFCGDELSRRAASRRAPWPYSRVGISSLGEAVEARHLSHRRKPLERSAAPRASRRVARLKCFVRNFQGPKCCN
jgi:hypothetical protein